MTTCTTKTSQTNQKKVIIKMNTPMFFAGPVNFEFPVWFGLIFLFIILASIIAGIVAVVGIIGVTLSTRKRNKLLQQDSNVVVVMPQTKSNIGVQDQPTCPKYNFQYGNYMLGLILDIFVVVPFVFTWWFLTTYRESQKFIFNAYGNGDRGTIALIIFIQQIAVVLFAFRMLARFWKGRTPGEVFIKAPKPESKYGRTVALDCILAVLIYAIPPLLSTSV